MAQLRTETALIEAILFLEPEPLSINSLVRISKLSKSVLRATLTELEKAYEEEGRGIELIRLGDTWQLAPKQVLWQQLKDTYGKENVQKLSRAAMETLSIIAYSQPVTKNEIEGIRGVSSDPMIKLLLSHDLVKELGRKDVIGKPIQYGTTKDFLKMFRLSSISDLPKLDEVEQSRFELK